MSRWLVCIVLVMLAAVFLAGCQSTVDTFTELVEKGKYQEARQLYNKSEDPVELDQWLVREASKLKQAYFSASIDYETAIKQLQELRKFNSVRSAVQSYINEVRRDWLINSAKKIRDAYLNSEVDYTTACQQLEKLHEVIGAKPIVQPYLEAVDQEHSLRVSQQSYQLALEKLESGKHKEAVALLSQVVEADPNYEAAIEALAETVNMLLEPLQQKTYCEFYNYAENGAYIYVPKGFAVNTPERSYAHWNLDKASIYPALYVNPPFTLALRITVGYIAPDSIDLTHINFKADGETFSWASDDKWYEVLASGYRSECCTRFIPGKMGWEDLSEQLQKIAYASSAEIEFRGKQGVIKQTVTAKEKEYLKLFLELYELFCYQRAAHAAGWN